MKNRRHSEISESESSEDQQPNYSSNSKSSTTNNLSAISSSNSDSSSDSEPRRPPNYSGSKHETTKSPKKCVNFSQLEQFVAQNLDLRRIQINNDPISEDDEVCLLELPKIIDPEELLGKLINFDKKTKIKVNKTKYMIEPITEGIKPFTVISKNLKVIHPVANLQLREYVKHKEDSSSVDSVNSIPTLPANLKIRHPLFGAKYENKIVLDEEIQQKLDDTIKQFIKKKKKKKKKKHEEINDEGEETIFTLLESHSMKGKKKKRDAQKEIESHKEEKETDPFIEKKKKRNLHRETEICEEDDETELFIEKKRKKHKDKQANVIENMIHKRKGEEKQELVPKHNNEGSNKKIKIINSTIIPGLHLPLFDFDVSSIMQKGHDADNKTENTLLDVSKEVDGELFRSDEDEKSMQSPKKKHKKAKTSLSSETEQGTTVDVHKESTDDGSSKKKKRKKDKHTKDDVDSEGEMLADVNRMASRDHPNTDGNENSGPSPKQKHKKHKEKESTAKEATNSLILDILSRVKDEMYSPIPKIKNKKKLDR